MISAWRPGLKTGTDFRGQVWKRVWKMTFFSSDRGSGFGEPGGTPPPKILDVPPPSLGRHSRQYWIFLLGGHDNLSLWTGSLFGEKYPARLKACSQATIIWKMGSLYCTSQLWWLLLSTITAVFQSTTSAHVRHASKKAVGTYRVTGDRSQ